MKLYDMIFRSQNDFSINVPNEIKKKIDYMSLDKLINKYNRKEEYFILDDIWEKTINLYKAHFKEENEYLKFNELIDYQKDKLFEDVKFHSIFIIYLSIVYNNKDKILIEKCPELYLNNIEPNRDTRTIYRNFSTNCKDAFEIYKNNKENIDSLFEFNKCFFEETSTLNKGKKYDKYETNLDPYIFYITYKNWKYCPYNPKYKFGMKFTDIIQFYNKWKVFMKKIYENENCDLLMDKLIKAYLIERFFSISFLFEVTRKVRDYDNYESMCNKLMDLCPIINFPMVFSRNKYIERLDLLTNRYISGYYYLSTEAILIYLSKTIIPILIKIFYSLISRYIKIKLNCKSENDIISCVKDLMKTYIYKNLDEYDYQQFYKYKGDEEFKDTFGLEALQINISYVVYKYCNSYFNKSLNYINSDIFRKDILKEDTLRTRINNKDFPFNDIYFTYKRYNKDGGFRGKGKSKNP
ncbi:hypothetical protein [Clostridium sp.]|nr:hypothetical protein [Clostridium sp.]MCI1716846.1 hypothetical protein [Clostridium sp.]MCI1801224.1 hypothetical protein [Clostridium sp.]MCI1815032.1 hypothetical protein [Clostridium sp.]